MPSAFTKDRSLEFHVHQERTMPRGDKSSYTDKQKRQAEHIEEGYEKCGISDREAARRAWGSAPKLGGGLPWVRLVFPGGTGCCAAGRRPEPDH
jgi:hypothetical protein